MTSSGLTWTIQRVTQFFDYVFNGAKGLARLPVIPIPAGFRLQAIDADEVAERLVELTLGEPAGRVGGIGGPEVSTWSDMLRAYLRATHKRRVLVSIPRPGTRAIREGALLVSKPHAPGRPTWGRRTWAEFLADRPPR